jgi:hypothetical protein
MNYFPQINPATLNALLTVKTQLEGNADYLQDSECPYDADVKEELGRLLSPKVVETVREVEKIVEIERRVEVAVAAAEGGGKRGPKNKPAVDLIDKELQDLVTDLRQLKTDSKVGDTAIRLQILKTRSVLLEKMVMLADKVTNVKRMSLFMSTVMSLLDDIMSDEQRQIFMKRLQPFADQE